MSSNSSARAAVQVVLTRAKASLCAMLVEGWLARAATARPAHPALVTPAATLSYEQLYADADAGAAQLAALGTGPGTRVGLALPAGLDFARALHACLLIGAAAVPIDLRLSDSERTSVAGACDLVLEEPLPVSGAGGPRGRARHDLDATALVMHTSGSSAAPKGVELSYGNLLWSALGSAVALGRPAGRAVAVCDARLPHGRTLDPRAQHDLRHHRRPTRALRDSTRALHALRRDGVTIVSLVATTLQRLLEGVWSGRRRSAVCCSGAAPWRRRC